MDATTCYEDLDQDGYGGSDTVIALDGSCDAADSESDNNADCDDTDPAINPGAEDTCGDGVDSDCDGQGGPTDDEDGDGCNWEQENAAGTSDCDVDSDSDQLNEMDEMGANCVYDAGETDPADPDTDGDGAWDGDEVLLMGTDPLDDDSDADGLGDSVEDEDHDGVPDPGDTDPMDADTDDDGLMDGEEDLNGNGVVDAGELNPLDPDTDIDFLNDGLELGRMDPVPGGVSSGWGLPFEGTAGGWTGDTDPSSNTDPLVADTDGDGLEDGEEDLDQDGYVDAEETDPNNPDTDDDTYSDGLEVECGSDPLDPLSFPDCVIFRDGFESGDLEGWAF